MLKINSYNILILLMLILSVSIAGASTKIIVKKGEKLPLESTAKLIEDYGAFKLYSLTGNEVKKLSQTNDKISIIEDMDTILFDSLTFDTQINKPKLNFKTDSLLATGAGLHIIQFVGPIKQDWLNQVKAQGVELISYIANNGYLVWADEQVRGKLDTMAETKDILQFSAPYLEHFKTGLSISQRIERQTNNNEPVNVIIQLAHSPVNFQSKQIIDGLAVKVESPWNKIMKFHSTRVTVRTEDIGKILALPDSYWVGEYFEITMNDEVQNQILTGNLSPDNSAPATPGYADFLSDKGFSNNPAMYPVVDITDDGLGNGTTTSGDPTFHEAGDINNPTRLSYVANCTAATTAEGTGGHGHINTSIVGGFESRVGFPYVDPQGYIRTQGVNPFTRLAATRVFEPGFDLSACGGQVGLIRSVKQNGADIMNNSWGCTGCAGTYDDSSQAFDAGTRDADATTAGNQELIMIFSAGNSGPGAETVGSPANGKNMIAVGASENFRPSDEDGDWTDGCGVGPTGVDNAMDVAGFSSRGPSPGGRIKPEIIAPGTHIQGTASTAVGYDGSSVCDQFRPSAQTDIAASTGTSHSAPAVAGVASLIYYWLENPPTSILGDFGTPSPAMIKAFLIAHPTYLTGASGADTLPSNSQGYGMPNMGLMFDDIPKYLYDQVQIFDNTGESWTWVGSASDPTKPVRIVMTYTDQPGAVGTSPQVNNLDLSVQTNGDNYLGNAFNGQISTTGGQADSANNYEAVFFPAGTATDLTITVIAANIAGDGVPNTGDQTDQDYALVCYNCTETPTFTLLPTNRSVDTCAPDDAIFNVNVNSVLGFDTPVTLSVSGVPNGVSSAFTVNPVIPGETTDFSITDISAIAVGSYPFVMNGIAGIENKSLDLTLGVFAQKPMDTTLSTPADGTIDVAPNAVQFQWSAIANATEYLFELSDQNDFSSIIESATISATNYTPESNLNLSTRYYWRIRPGNICGSAVSPVEFSFTTANEICTQIAPVNIPDNNQAGVDINLNLTDNGIIQSMLVNVHSNHPFPGDLIFTLTHDDTATTVTLMDRPGVPATTFGCSRDGVEVIFDDASNNVIETACAGSPPGVGGIFAPEQALSNFAGENISGSWTFKVSDNIQVERGSITQFCLIPSYETVDTEVIFVNGFETKL
ncbi:MAG: S8 family serine peptidase [Proteobacteria bacterium]|nr:S8 family serine peptidase [Pseudomonadota bacterium]